MSAQTCLRCGTPYEAEDTVCFTCGAPIGETKTPTQPVAIPRSRPVAPSEPLPSQAAPTAVAAPPRSSSRPPTRSSTRRAPAAKGALPDRPTGRRWPVFALLVLLALVGGGVGIVVHATLAEPPVASVTLYKNSALGVSFSRPTLWTLTARPNGATLTDSDGTDTVGITVAAPAADETAKSHADALAAAGLAPAAPRQIGGETWEQRSGQITGKDGGVRQDVLFVTLHGGRLYSIELSSPLTSFTATDNLVYQPLLNSFAFG